MRKSSLKTFVIALCVILLATRVIASSSYLFDGNNQVTIKVSSAQGVPRTNSILASINGHTLTVTFTENLGDGMTLLQYLLNLIETYNTDPNVGSTYAVPHDSVKPLPNNHLDTSSDPSPNYINSRIYITNGIHLENIPEFDMCYYLQSYHELGLSYLYNTTLLGDVITSWRIVEDTLHCDPHQPYPESINAQNVFYHQLTISYGFVATHGGGYDK